MQSVISSDGANPEGSPRFFYFGGWCPHLTSLEPKEDGCYTKDKDYTDVHPPEKVNLTYHINAGLVSKISVGIPEQLFVHANVELDENGLFILKARATLDWEQTKDAFHPFDITKMQVLAGILYEEIKSCHHIHTHHPEEEDRLLTLIHFANRSSGITIKNGEIRAKIINHVYEQYATIKPRRYTQDVKALLGSKPTPEQLEQAIRILYKGLGETAFGIAFLSRLGKEIFHPRHLPISVIKMEASMRSIEALKGLYTFEFMKSRRGNISKDIVEAIIKGVIQGIRNP